MGQGTRLVGKAASQRDRQHSRSSFTLLSSEFLDELRSRIILSQLIGRFVPLKKAGNEFKACCPFHQERTPSFWVNDDKAFYHCFGCSAHGDAIRFLTDSRGLSFMDAVKQLADEVGLELPKPEPEALARQERAASLHEALEAAAAYFENNLTSAEGLRAREYLKARDVDEGPITSFRLGFAPEGRGNLKQALMRFPTEQLVEAGLLISVEDKEPYDRFRGRLMVPIRDPRGRVVGFGGRILGDGEPKYLNSPETPLFDKGRILFNLDRAAPASRQAQRIIVVEGYFDVIALDKAGVREAVAPMGTAVTENQLELLWRLVDEPILCFDGDSAGFRAASRAVERALPILRPGKELSIALLPKGQDPDDLIRQGGRDEFETVVEKRLPLAEFLYQWERSKIDPERPEQRALLRQRLEEVSQSCADRLVGDEFARTLRRSFYDDFGWKKPQRQAILSSVVRTSARIDKAIARLIIRSTLYGLTRFPTVAGANLEALAAIEIAHPDLQRWRDAIGEAVTLHPSLDEDGIRTILETNTLPELIALDVRGDLRFGFVRKAAEPARAIKQLETLLHFLGRDSELIEQMEQLDRQAVADAGGDRYYSIEAARERLRKAKLDLYSAGAEWDAEFE